MTMKIFILLACTAVLSNAFKLDKRETTVHECSPGDSTEEIHLPIGSEFIDIQTDNYGYASYSNNLNCQKVIQSGVEDTTYAITVLDFKLEKSFYYIFDSLCVDGILKHGTIEAGTVYYITIHGLGSFTLRITTDGSVTEDGLKIRVSARPAMVTPSRDFEDKCKTGNYSNYVDTNQYSTQNYFSQDYTENSYTTFNDVTWDSASQAPCDSNGQTSDWNNNNGQLWDAFTPSWEQNTGGNWNDYNEWNDYTESYNTEENYNTGEWEDVSTASPEEFTH